MHSRRALAIHRSQIAFARGAWTGVVMIRMPAAAKTASNASVYLADSVRCLVVVAPWCSSPIRDLITMGSAYHPGMVARR